MNNVIPPGIIEFEDHVKGYYKRKKSTEAQYPYNDWVGFHLFKPPANAIHRIEVKGKEFAVGDTVMNCDNTRRKIKAFDWYKGNWFFYVENDDCFTISDYTKVIPFSGSDLGKDAQEEIENIFKESKPVEKTYTLDEVIAMIFAELKFYKLKSEADKDYYALINTLKENIEKDKVITSLKSWPTDEEVEAEAYKAGTDGRDEFRKAIRWLKEWKHPQTIGTGVKLIGVSEIKIAAENKYPMTPEDRHIYGLTSDTAVQHDRRNAFELGAEWIIKKLQQ